MAQKKYYCPYCPESERKAMPGQGLAAHQRAIHPGKPYKKLHKKKDPPSKKTKEPFFSLEPVAKDRASDGYDAEIRLRIVLKIDVET